MAQPEIVKYDAAPLHDHSIERQLLGALLIDNNVWHHRLICSLVPSDFADERHRTIYTCMLAQYDAGRSFDLSILCSELNKRGEMEAAGGYMYVSMMEADTPGSFEAPFYAEIIKGYSTTRRIHLAATRALNRIADGQDAETVYSLLQADAELAFEASDVQTDGNLWRLSNAESYVEPDGFHILGDGLLTLGGLLGIIGPGGIGKSRLTLQLAMDLACGRPDWCGIKIRREGRPTRVLFLQVENNRSRLKFDLTKQAARYTPQERELIEENLVIYAPSGLSDSIVNFDDPAAVRQIIRKIRKVKPEIVAFDPWAAFSSAEDENAAAQTNAAIREIKRAVCLGAGPDAGIILVHHSKYGKDATASLEGWDSAAYARGSKAFVSALRAQINIGAGEENCGDTLVVACGKCNDGRRFPTFAVTLDDRTMSYNRDEDFDLDSWRQDFKSNPKKQGRPSKIDTEDVIAYMREQSNRGCSKRELAQHLVASVGVSRSVAYAAISTALRDRVLCDNGHGIISLNGGIQL